MATPTIKQNIDRKTTVRMSRRTAVTLDKILMDIGLSRNAYFVMSSLFVAATFARTVRSPHSFLDELEAAFAAELERAREGQKK